MPKKIPTKAEIEETLKKTQGELEEAKSKVNELEAKKVSPTPDKAHAKKVDELTKQNSELQSILNGKTDELNSKMKASGDREKTLIHKNIQLVNELRVAKEAPVAKPEIETKNLVQDVSGNIYETFPGNEQIAEIFQREFLTMPNRRIKDIGYWVKENGQWVRRK